MLMLMQPITDRQANIVCKQQSIVTDGGKQAIREADARKYECLEVPYIVYAPTFASFQAWKWHYCSL
jgi:hypothetical protein